MPRKKDLMRGLELPPALARGKPRLEDVEPWIKLTEELIGRGIRSPTQLRKVLGVPYRTADNWMREVRKRWTRGLTDDRVNWRRETLYSEADAVARAAWLESMDDEATPSQKASLFKIVLLANQRKASLTGLDVMEVKIKKEVRTTTIIDLVARVETEFALAPGALGSIGRQAAKALSGEVLELPPLQLTAKGSDDAKSYTGSIESDAKSYTGSIESDAKSYTVQGATRDGADSSADKGISESDAKSNTGGKLHSEAEGVVVVGGKLDEQGDEHEGQGGGGVALCNNTRGDKASSAPGRVVDSMRYGSQKSDPTHEPSKRVSDDLISPPTLSGDSLPDTLPGSSDTISRSSDTEPPPPKNETGKTDLENGVGGAEKFYKNSIGGYQNADFCNGGRDEA